MRDRKQRERERSRRRYAETKADPAKYAAMKERKAREQRLRRAAQRGPSGARADAPYIPEAHELAGVSTLTDEAGNVKARWDKTRVAGADEPPTAIPESFHLKRASVMQRGDGSTVVQWSSYAPEEVARFEAIKAAIKEHCAEYVRPAEPLEAPTHTSDDLLVAYPLGDPHIGMLAWAPEVGEHFDLRIAERELAECMRQMVARAPAAKRAIVANLGDFWHSQDDLKRTPKSGHPLDGDGRFAKVAKVGLRLFRTLIDTALTKHEHVTVRSLPGNHDPSSAMWITESLEGWYSREPRVTIEPSDNPYQFDTFGKCLLGWAHGDGAKLETLGEIMSTDVPEQWGASAFRFWNTGHIHHLQTKELRGCVVTTHRTLAGKDAWHHHSGYRSGRSLMSIAYHREWGRDGAWDVGVERVRAAILANGGTQ